MNRPVCQGSAHVIPVPPGMDADAAWAEITTLGRLTAYQGDPTWAAVECHGGERCACRGVSTASNYRRWHNGQLVEARVLGFRMPGLVVAMMRWFEAER